MNHIFLSFIISRPRFWSYIAGPYILGYVLSLNNISSINFSIFFSSLAFFIFPANVFLYGINDYHDVDTDYKNEKKKGKEIILNTDSRKKIIPYLVFSVIFFLIFFLFQPNNTAKILSLVFFFLCFAYSAKPFRFKSVPILDFLSNSLYSLPGFIGYYQNSSENFLNLPTIISITTWTWAMHLFSAIPDIKNDKMTNITTSAVLMGKRKSLILCLLIWTYFFIFIYQKQFLYPYNLVLLIYPAIPIMLLIKTKININKIYWLFPFLNTLIGTISTFVIIYKKI